MDLLEDSSIIAFIQERLSWKFYAVNNSCNRRLSDVGSERHCRGRSCGATRSPKFQGSAGTRIPCNQRLLLDHFFILIRKVTSRGLWKFVQQRDYCRRRGGESIETKVKKKTREEPANKTGSFHGWATLKTAVCFITKLGGLNVIIPQPALSYILFSSCARTLQLGEQQIVTFVANADNTLYRVYISTLIVASLVFLVLDKLLPVLRAYCSFFRLLV